MNTEIAVSESTSLMDRIAAVLKGVASSETIGAMIAEAEAEVRRLSTSARRPASSRSIPCLKATSWPRRANMHVRQSIALGCHLRAEGIGFGLFFAFPSLIKGGAKVVEGRSQPLNLNSSALGLGDLTR